MRRLLVVSRNPAVSMGLVAGDHDVLEVRPNAFDTWVERCRDEPLDAIVLDLESADSAWHAITELRARAQMAPVLVVPGDGIEWDDERLRELPAAAVLTRPVTAPDLQAAVIRMLEHGSASFTFATVAATNVAASARPEEETPAAPTGRSVGAGLDDPGSAPLERSAADDDPDVGSLIDRVTAAPSLPLAPTPDVSTPHVPAPHEPSGADPVRRWSVPAPPIEVAPVAPSARGVDLVRDLLTRTDDLYGVAETAEVIVRDAIERVGAEASALLLPDASRWRVVAGVGLRPLERRFELTEHDWLVVEVAQAGRSVVMEDTDLVRQPLRGSPLASWHHLVATPVPLVHGVLLVARSTDPGFRTGDVEALAALAAEAAPLVVDSMDVRTLARRLTPFTDPVTP